MNKDKFIAKLEQEINADHRAREYFVNRLTIDEVDHNIATNELKLAIIKTNDSYKNDIKDFKLNINSILDSLPKEVWFDE